MATRMPVMRPESLVPTMPTTVSAATMKIAPKSGIASSPASQVGRPNSDLEVRRPAARHDRRAQAQLQHEVPADDPGHQLAERRVAEGVRAAGHRHGRRELGVAQGGQRAHDGGEQERQHDRRAGVAGRLLPGEHEDAGADDHADAEDGEVERAQVALEPMARLVGLQDRFFDALGSEDPARHINDCRPEAAVSQRYGVISAIGNLIGNGRSSSISSAPSATSA